MTPILQLRNGTKLYRGVPAVKDVSFEAELLEAMKQRFASVHHIKPPASRDGSVELYLLAKGFKGRD